MFPHDLSILPNNSSHDLMPSPDMMLNLQTAIFTQLEWIRCRCDEVDVLICESMLATLGVEVDARDIMKITELIMKLYNTGHARS